MIVATITGVQIIISETDELTGVKRTIATETRPANLAEADSMLAVHSLGRIGAWDLDNAGGVSATVRPVDNRFNGTVAARLDDAVGTTHDEWDLAAAASVRNGDLITDPDRCATYVVAGSCVMEGGLTKIHQVGEGKTWEDRYTGFFHGLIYVARKR